MQERLTIENLHGPGRHSFGAKRLLENLGMLEKAFKEHVGSVCLISHSGLVIARKSQSSEKLIVYDMLRGILISIYVL